MKFYDDFCTPGNGTKFANFIKEIEDGVGRTVSTFWTGLIRPGDDKPTGDQFSVSFHPPKEKTQTTTTVRSTD